MTTRPRKGKTEISEGLRAKIPKNILTIERQGTKSDARVLTELGMSPIIANANTTRIFARPTTEDIDITEAVAVLRERASAVQAGNLAGLEETLTAQAVALDAIFNEMARRTALNMADYLPAATTPKFVQTRRKMAWSISNALSQMSTPS